MLFKSVLFYLDSI